jgi:hypothetical protein
MGNYHGPDPPEPAAGQQRKPLSDSGNILQPEARLADFDLQLGYPNSANHQRPRYPKQQR